jgi:hypothetical protein
MSSFEVIIWKGVCIETRKDKPSTNMEEITYDKNEEDKPKTQPRERRVTCRRRKTQVCMKSL